MPININPYRRARRGDTPQRRLCRPRRYERQLRRDRFRRPYPHKDFRAGRRPRNIRGVVSYKRSFPDLNDAHLEVAKKIGIRPLADREAAEDMKEKLTHITDNEFYVVDSLTHSIPYLVPRASALLDTIGSNFLDSLAAKGLNPNQVIITSVLRTENDVKRLRRRNGNASANSAHCFGATFDVSWKRFKKVEDKDGRPLQDVSADTLKLVLSEVLRDLRQAEKCYIKYELKQGCFHITAR